MLKSDQQVTNGKYTRRTKSEVCSSCS